MKGYEVKGQATQVRGLDSRGLQLPCHVTPSAPQPSEGHVEGAAVLFSGGVSGPSEAPVASSQSEQPGGGWVAGLGTQKLSVRWRLCVGTSRTCLPYTRGA